MCSLRQWANEGNHLTHSWDMPFNCQRRIIQLLIPCCSDFERASCCDGRDTDWRGTDCLILSQRSVALESLGLRVKLVWMRCKHLYIKPLRFWSCLLPQNDLVSLDGYLINTKINSMLSWKILKYVALVYWTGTKLGRNSFWKDGDS